MVTEEEKKAIESLKIKIEFMGDNYYKIMGSQVFNDLRKETKVALNLIEKLQKENEEYKRLHINIQGMRNGKQLLTKYIKDSVPKDKIREKLDTFFDNLIYVRDKNELKEALKEELLEEEQ